MAVAGVGRQVFLTGIVDRHCERGHCGGPLRVQHGELEGILLDRMIGNETQIGGIGIAAVRIHRQCAVRAIEHGRMIWAHALTRSVFIVHIDDMQAADVMRAQPAIIAKHPGQHIHAKRVARRDACKVLIEVEGILPAAHSCW